MSHLPDDLEYFGTAKLEYSGWGGILRKDTTAMLYYEKAEGLPFNIYVRPDRTTVYLTLTSTSSHNSSVTSSAIPVTVFNSLVVLGGAGTDHYFCFSTSFGSDARIPVDLMQENVQYYLRYIGSDANAPSLMVGAINTTNPFLSIDDGSGNIRNNFPVSPVWVAETP